MNKQTTTTKPKRVTAPKTSTKPAGAKAGTGKGKVTGQKQDLAPAVAAKQGEGTSGKPPVAATPAPAPKVPAASPTPSVVLGGTAQVPIEVVAVSKKPYTPRERKPEKYPFGDARLTPAKKAKDGEIVGPSFFIPDSDKAAQKLAVARKRHKGVLFWSRKRQEQVDGKGPKVSGLRIWRGAQGLDPK